MAKRNYVTYKDKFNTKYGYSKGESHTLEQVSKDTGVSMKGLQQIYNKGIGAYKTNPQSVRPNVKSKEQWAMARVYSAVMGGKASKIDSAELKMAKGGLIAPNGKKSNLTALQYKLVRTSEFKSWFGDWENSPETASKVVDENGEPLVVYHGTTTDFYVFGEGKNSQILPEYQSEYQYRKNTNYFHKDIEYSKTFGSENNGFEKAYFLNVRNIELVDEDTIEDIGYWKNIYDYYVLEEAVDGVYSKSGQYATLLNPSQIKLADGTNKTFDGSNPDIRFEEGGNVDEAISKLESVTSQQKNTIKRIVSTIERANGKQTISILNIRKGHVILNIFNVRDKVDVITTTTFCDVEINTKGNITKGFYNYLTPKVETKYPYMKKGGMALNTQTGENWYSKGGTERKYDGGGMTEKNQTQMLIDDLTEMLPFLDEQEQESTQELINDLQDVLIFMDESIEEEVQSTDFPQKEYSYLMTLDQYKESPIPALLQDYKKFTKKNEKSLLPVGYSGSDFMTLEEYLELGKESPLYSEKDIMGRPQTKSVEMVITDYFMDRKTQWRKKPEDYVPASNEVIEQNKKYREQLLMFFEKDKYGRIRIEADELKSNKRAIKNAMEDGTYKDLLSSGDISIERLKEITDSVGVRITKDTLSGDKAVEFKETMAKELKNIPKKSFDELMEFSSQVKKDLDVVGKDVYERESKRIREGIESSVGKQVESTKLFTSIPFYQMVSDSTKEDKYNEGWNGKKVFAYSLITINSYDKQKFEFQLKKYLDEYVEYLKWNIIKAMVQSFVYITRPLKSFERIYLKIGAKGFEGIYKFIFDDGSNLYLETQGIGAGGYNIQRFHYRYISNFNNYQLANGEPTDLSHFKEKNMKTFEQGGWMKRKYAEGGKITQFEIEAMRNYINGTNPNPKLKDSFEKVLRKFGVDPETSVLSDFKKGTYTNPYNFSGYEYMRKINEEAGVSFLLTGEYQLVSKAIYEKDYAMWLFYSYLGRINISFKACQDWLKQAQEYFEYTMPIPIVLEHAPNAKDGRSYAMWFATNDKVNAESKIGRKMTFKYNDRWYYQEIGMVGNFDDKKSDGWGSLYKEKKTGLLIPEYTETSFHFNTLIHEFSHCLDFQTQLLKIIDKYDNKNEKKISGEIQVNTETMSDAELALYATQLSEEARKDNSMSLPITNHFDEFVDSLIRTLRACAGGHIPLTQLYEQQALDVQQALEGVYGDLLLEQRERKAKERREVEKADELREDKRYTWQTGSLIADVKEYAIKNALQSDLKEKLNSKRKPTYTLSEAIEFDNLIAGYFNTEYKRFMLRNPTKATQRLEDLKKLKEETNRLINNHYDNIKSGYQNGFTPSNELEYYLAQNCSASDFRDYKSWKECMKESFDKFQ